MRRGGFSLLVLMLLAGTSHSATTPDPSAITIVAGGDILLDRGVRMALEVTGDPTYPFTAIAPLLRAADLGIANLECALVDSGVPIYKQFMFRGDAAMARVLRSAGFTALSLANNHAYDYGRDALMATARRLAAVGIEPLGAGPDQQAAARPRFVEIHGVRIALLAFVDLELEGLVPLEDRASPALADSARMRAAVAQARDRADFVIVSMHWGNEYSPFPSERQARLARLLAAAGADVVIGHHPHVIEPFEWLGGTLVLYSLGNLVFDRQRPGCEDELLLRVRIRPKGASASATAADAQPVARLGGSSRAGLTWTAELVPVWLSNCRPEPAVGERARTCLARASARH